MAEPIDFYFDFSSPYGYLASCRIDEVAARHGRKVNWRPFLLGVAFKLTGSAPLTSQGPKGDYALHDFARTARLFGVPFTMPEGFPFASIAAARAFYWLLDQDEDAARALAKALFKAAFVQGTNISVPAVVIEVARQQGVDGDDLAAALQDPAVKQRLRDQVELTMSYGVFGSPYFIVDGEQFWGVDRLPHVDQWLSQGGW
ncbi:MAG: 2-hydroxychromene-2-carboxylate isomerase [Alphaproteobacteria bacterium]